ncbi:MAG: uracil-DNA glycosylase [Peptostreptococcaceae bacterium]|nr:uracil-DNA glycosylase [Peptostreptococcaceae bacterium]
MVHLGNSWDEILAEEFKKPYYLKLREFLKKEYATETVYPDMYHIFEAFKRTPYENVKVVILGQDPYHGPGQAHGLSFSVLPKVKTPPSLVNIYKELQQDLGTRIPNNGCLISWANQGVFLLNASLTVRRGEANSHQKIGWEQFTSRVIEILGERKQPMVFLLWGKNAMEKEAMIPPHSPHLILKAPHPSPFSADRGFFGCRHFSKANEFLLAKGISSIDWQIEDI